MEATNESHESHESTVAKVSENANEGRLKGYLKAMEIIRIIHGVYLITGFIAGSSFCD